MVSIHALLAECDLLLNASSAAISLFQSTHSLRSATSTHRERSRDRMVSIHALLAECDREMQIAKNRYHSFNPRTPCGVRLPAVMEATSLHRFQSTHSLRSATQGCRSPHRTGTVSIHALLAECDRSKPILQSTSLDVSIHALLAECDQMVGMLVKKVPGFNPRTPCGVRQNACPPPSRKWRFQSTHSLRSATEPAGVSGGLQLVSIHALLAECDTIMKGRNGLPT